jgi:hypothetical protein
MKSNGRKERGQENKNIADDMKGTLKEKNVHKTICTGRMREEEF